MKVAQSCLTLCNPRDYTAHGILRARILEWVAFPFSRGSSQPRGQTRSPTLQADSLLAKPQRKPIEKFCLLLVEFFFFFLIEPKILCKFQVKVKVKSLSHVRLFVTLWTIAHHSPLSIEFSKQEYWSGLPFPSPRDLPNPRIELGSPALQVFSLPTELLGNS